VESGGAGEKRGRRKGKEKMERDKWETADENVRYEELGDGEFAE